MNINALQPATMNWRPIPCEQRVRRHASLDQTRVALVVGPSNRGDFRAESNYATILPSVVAFALGKRGISGLFRVKELPSIAQGKSLWVWQF